MNPEYIERLNTTLGMSLEQSAKEISILYKKLSEAYELKKNNSNPNIDNDITVMEVYILVLYTTIAIAVFFRGDFNSEYIVEKRLNLKYLSFVSTEFYKSLFLTKKPLWHKLESILSIGNNTNLTQIIGEVNQASSKFQDDYFDSERRNISIHYDTDLDKVYSHLCKISEEYEAKHIESLLAILKPLSLVCSSYLYSVCSQVPITPTDSKENSAFEKFRKKLYEDVYDLTGSKIQDFANHLDHNMQSFHLIDSPMIKELMTEVSYLRLSQFRECSKLGILLHYFYLDLGTAVRGYLRTDNFYEQQINVIRINLIVYEGYKKIFLPQSDNQNMSLWEKHIKVPVSVIACPEYLEEAEAIEKILQGYSQNTNLENIRHNFSHFKNKKGNTLTIVDLWHSIISINPLNELNKALDFLKLIARIIKLCKPCMEYFSQEEHERTKQSLTAPLENIFTNAMNSCKTIEDNERLQIVKNELKNMILEIFEKLINSYKRSND